MLTKELKKKLYFFKKILSYFLLLFKNFFYIEKANKAKHVITLINFGKILNYFLFRILLCQK